jgi:hypothetical protein
MASALGALLAFWGSALLVTSLSQRFPLPGIAFSWTMLVVPSGLAALSGLLCGLPPALMLWRSRLNDTLKQDARNQSTGIIEQRLGNLLMVKRSCDSCWIPSQPCRVFSTRPCTPIRRSWEVARKKRSPWRMSRTRVRIAVTSGSTS